MGQSPSQLLRVDSGLEKNRELRYPLRDRILKRILDVAGAVLLLVALSPLWLVIGISIVMLEGAPIIHRRRVVGPKGEFDAFKFRTMRRDADLVLQQDPALWNAFQENFKL